MKSDLFSMLENAFWPALLVDNASTIRKANQAAIRIFGPGLDGGTSKLAAIWSREGGASPEQLLAEWERAPISSTNLKLRTRGGANTSFPVVICSAQLDGQRVYLLQFLQQILGGSVGNGDSPQNLKQKLDCALQLAGTVALDFNNALTGIFGHASYVLAQMEEAHPWRAALREIEKSASRAAEIAVDLGTFSRQDKEGRSHARENLNPVLHRVVEVARQGPGGGGIAWCVQLEKSLYAAKFDEPKIQQAFSKIIENATQAQSNGGSVTVHSRNVDVADALQDGALKLGSGSYVCAEVSDTGCGIAREILPRIFEPFFTTKHGHRGLGLAWVYGIVTNHGGGVAVSSEPGRGTSVRVYLPAEKRHVKEDAPLSTDLRGSQTLLIVDDEEMLLTMARTILGSYGYQVLTAGSGQRALELLGAPGGKVDLVITDMIMPGMSGRELVEQIQKLAPALPILRTSGFVGGGNGHETQGYLQKPYTAQELLSKVKWLLQRSAGSP